MAPAVRGTGPLCVKGGDSVLAVMASPSLALLTPAASASVVVDVSRVQNSTSGAEASLLLMLELANGHRVLAGCQSLRADRCQLVIKWSDSVVTALNVSTSTQNTMRKLTADICGYSVGVTWSDGASSQSIRAPLPAAWANIGSNSSNSSSSSSFMPGLVRVGFTMFANTTSTLCMAEIAVVSRHPSQCGNSSGNSSDSMCAPAAGEMPGYYNNSNVAPCFDCKLGSSGPCRNEETGQCMAWLADTQQCPPNTHPCGPPPAGGPNASNYNYNNSSCNCGNGNNSNNDKDDCPLKNPFNKAVLNPCHAPACDEKDPMTGGRTAECCRIAHFYCNASMDPACVKSFEVVGILQACSLFYGSGTPPAPVMLPEESNMVDCKVATALHQLTAQLNGLQQVLQGADPRPSESVPGGVCLDGKTMTGLACSCWPGCKGCEWTVALAAHEIMPGPCFMCFANQVLHQGECLAACPPGFKVAGSQRFRVCKPTAK
jgi:hypothetical protein